MVLSVNCLLCTHEVLSSDLQHPHKKPGSVACIWGVRTHCPASLAKLTNSKFLNLLKVMWPRGKKYLSERLQFKLP